MTLGKQIRKYREQLGWTLEDLENRSGVGRGTISALENRGSQRSTHAPAIAKAFGVTLEQLLDPHNNWLDARGAGQLKTQDIDHSTHMYQFDAGGAMGDGVALRDQPGVIQSWTVSKEWLEKNVGQHTGAKNLFIVTGFGDSMRPLFNPGDPLLVDVGVKTVDFDAVYFFRIGDEGFIKRLQRIPTENGLVIRAISENRTAYEPFDITEKMDFEILGRVLKVWCSSEF